ncbi:MAG: DUF4167 domain-containing protein [Hyphomicrobiaceae bacterium]|nr:DUF4167 domain-containing protein [Hyphomicrobiaceae bacterium]
MRQGQQNRRGRGRNRKSQNPLTRSFESNGPDVKIRGTPAHIAEKYISLARDAQSSGDPVLAESYLQHAEHYNRIIMAFREQQIQQGGDPAQIRRPQGSNEFSDADDFGDEDGDDVGAGDFGQGIMGPNDPQPSIRSFEPQQRQDNFREGGRGEGQPNEHRRDNRGEGRNRGDYQFRQNRDRHQNGQRNGGEQREQREQHAESGRSDQPRREQREPREPRESREPPRENRENNRQESGARREGRNRRDFGGSGPGEQPEFLRRSVRRPRREDKGEPGVAQEAAAAEDSAE